MPKRRYTRRQQRRSLSNREREILIFRYANPELTIRQLSFLLSLLPGELTRLLRLEEAKEYFDVLVETFDPDELRLEYQLANASVSKEPSKLFSAKNLRELTQIQRGARSAKSPVKKSYK
jgi:hypothetical protein